MAVQKLRFIFSELVTQFYFYFSKTTNQGMQYDYSTDLYLMRRFYLFIKKSSHQTCYLLWHLIKLMRNTMVPIFCQYLSNDVMLWVRLLIKRCFFAHCSMQKGGGKQRGDMFEIRKSVNFSKLKHYFESRDPYARALCKKDKRCVPA